MLNTVQDAGTIIAKQKWYLLPETLLGFVQFLFSDVDHWKNAKLIAKSKKSKIGYISCYKYMIC